MGEILVVCTAGGTREGCDDGGVKGEKKEEGGNRGRGAVAGVFR